MNECPECGGLIIEDIEDDDYIDRVYGWFCPGCGWCSEETSDEDDDNEICSTCGGVGSNHSAICPEDDAIWY